MSSLSDIILTSYYSAPSGEGSRTGQFAPHIRRWQQPFVIDGSDVEDVKH